jgi:hypothetical protein
MARLAQVVRTTRQRIAVGQTTVEYVLVVALFAVPVSYWFFSRLLRATWMMFRTMALDLSGPGI